VSGTDNPYDRVPYATQPNRHARPDRLAAIGTLYGLQPAAASRCRVLEIGCGDGGHLLPLACLLPHSAFIGVDLAPGAIAKGRQAAKRIALTNVRFLHADIRALPPDLGVFDYVVAHGVYSWIARDAHDALLAAIAARLECDGMAFVSFDAMPGGHLRGMLRDLLRFHTEGIDDPLRRLAEARALLDLLTRETDGETPANIALRLELREAAARSDQALAHDDLAADHSPAYFHEFVAHAGSHGLAYVADAHPTVSAVTGLSPQTCATLERLDRLAREQYLDFLRCRRFRQALVCRSERALSPTSDRIDPLHALLTGTLASRIMAGQPWFPDAAAEALPDPARRVIDIVAAGWPSPVPISQIIDRTEAAPDDARALILGAHAAGLIDLVDGSLRAGSAAERYPFAPAHVREQAAAHEPIVNVYQQTIRLEAPGACSLVALLDGTRDVASLRNDWNARNGASCDGAWLDARLADVARLALLCG
jgi:SAM-dependent methyltransferase